MSTTIEDGVDRNEFYRRIDEVLKSKQAPNTFLVTRERYYRLIEQVKNAKTNFPKTPADFRRAKRFEVIKMPDGDRLFMALLLGQTEQQMYVPVEEMYDIIREYHLKLNHGGRSRMMTDLKKKYKNITAQSVLVYLSLCNGCKDKSNKRRTVRPRTRTSQPVNDVFTTEEAATQNSIDSDPLASESHDGIDSDTEENTTNAALIKVYPELYSRGQVDILEVTSVATEEFKYMLVYRNFVTKFIHLKPLKATNVDDTVDALLEIFLVFGAPNILQSKNGMPVAMPICRRVTTLCPEIKIVASEMNFSELDFRGKSNKDILRMLNEWIAANKNAKWRQGLKFVQNALNTTFHDVMCRTPSELVFGIKPSKGLASMMSTDEYDVLSTEDDLRKALEHRDHESRSPKHLKLEESLILPCNFIKKEPDTNDIGMLINDDDGDE